MQKKKTRFGVLVFPGSNCDYDCFHVAQNVLGTDTQFIWHDLSIVNYPFSSDDINSYDCLIVPGGFSYGDYLRCGAIANHSRIMESVRNFAQAGGYIIGICNGFQILTESGLLPGVLLRNSNLRFICKQVYIKPINYDGNFTRAIPKDKTLQIPIAHNEGNYYLDAKSLNELVQNGQNVFSYCSVDGQINDQANPNGALLNIAGITNRKGNVLGMMPHPERVSESILGSTDGLDIFKSIYNAINNVRN